MAVKAKGLGRGLGALIQESPAEPAQDDAAVLRKVAVDAIRRNRSQPRHRFDPEALAELAGSIREQGVLQPLLVRRDGTGFELIAGERRLRAAIEAGLTEVPVMLMEVTDERAMEVALIENLQREDLNPMEEAEGYQALIRQFGLTQEQVAQRVGKARTSIANALRLLTLPEEVRHMVIDGVLSTGHAKILAGLEIEAEQRLLARRVQREHLSVRQLEKLAASTRASTPPPRPPRSDIPAAHVSDLTEKLQQYFGTGVRIVPSRKLANGRTRKGSIAIDFYNTDDLDRLLVMLGMQDIV